MSQSTEVQQFKLSPAVIEAAEVNGDRNTHRLRGWELTVLMIDSDPWFVAREIGRVLDLVNVRTSVALLDDDERGVHTIDTPGGQQELTIISEAGLYSLILRSRVPAARAFKRWVTHEVLPAVRKTGAYAEPVRPKTRVELARELLAAEERAEALAKDLDAKTNMLSAAVAITVENAPKVEAFNELMSADGSVSLAEAAQLVGIGRQTLIDKLAQWGAIIVRPGHSDHLRPYQAQVRAGRFVLVAQTVPITHGDGTCETLAKSVTRVTAKGVEWIRQQQKTSGPKSLIRRTS